MCAGEIALFKTTHKQIFIFPNQSSRSKVSHVLLLHHGSEFVSFETKRLFGFAVHAKKIPIVACSMRTQKL